MPEDAEDSTAALQAALTATKSEISDAGSPGDAMQGALSTVDEFTIPHANASKITNSHVLGSNTWLFVILDGISWPVLPCVDGGV